MGLQELRLGVGFFCFLRWLIIITHRLESDSGKLTCFALSRHYASNAGVCYDKPFGADIDTIVKNIVVVV